MSYMTPCDEPTEVESLFHRLYNQLGVILANAELLEAQLAEGKARSRAGLIMSSVVEAMGTARELRAQVDSWPSLALSAGRRDHDKRQ